MMKNINTEQIVSRIKRLLLVPAPEWQIISKENYLGRDLFCNFIIYPSIIASFFTLLIRLFFEDIWLACCWGIINFIACVAGSYICFRLAKEYLSNKIRRANTISLHLSIYSSTIFILFHSLSVGFTGKFIGDLAAILSLLSLRTLYIGANILPELDDRYRKSTTIIIGVLIICITAILTRLLTILFRIPAINT